MKPVTVKVGVSDSGGNLDTSKLRASQKKVADLVSRGRPVLVLVQQGNTGKIHLEYAKRYSKDVSIVVRALKQANAQLTIAALRAAKIPTYPTPFENSREAKRFLMKNVAAAVV